MPPTTVARRNYGAAAKRQKEEVERRFRDYRKKVRESKVPKAVGNAAMVVAGSATAGAIVGYGYPQIMGVDTDVALGIAAIALGIGMGRPEAIMFGTGALTQQVGAYAAEKAAEMRSAA